MSRSMPRSTHRFVLHLSRTSLLAFALSSAALGCRSGAGGAVNAAAGAPRLKITERAETGPITAIAARGGVVYAGTSRGLRRWDVASDDYETVGALAGVTAVGVDGDGAAWVATESGVGRFVRGKAQGDQATPETFESLGGLGNITSLAPTTEKDGAWAGGGDGLFRWDGKGWSPVGEVRGVTSLELDRDGRSAWVGTRALGLFVAEGESARVVPLGDDPAGLEIVGTAVTAVGTRVVGARTAGDDAAGGRLFVLQEGEPQAFRAQPDVRVVRVVDTGKDAVLVAGAAGAERAYSLTLLRAGEDLPAGALRFVSVKKGTPGVRSRDRWVAVPLGELPPPGVTVAAGSDGAVYYGTERRGVARGAKGRPAFFSGAELVGDAEHFSVACAARDRCFVATDGPRAWVTDGDVYRATRVGEADDAVVLAVAADRAGTIYALSAEPKYSGLVITRLAEAVVVGAAQAAVGDTWRTHDRVPLVMPPGTQGPAGVSFAAIAPSGALWVGLRARTEGGDDVSIGAAEIDLAAHRAIQHRAPKEGEKARPEVLPLPDALTGVFFDDGATWFSSLSGVSRWQQGDLRTWGENDGLASELVHGVAKGPGDAIWAATSEGLARLDDKVWRAYGGGAEEAIVACRGVARDGQGDMWIATAKGLRRLTPADAAAGRFGDVVVGGDQHDVKLDRFGRIWALASSSIALVEQ
jgi:hypothetical protein